MGGRAACEAVAEHRASFPYTVELKAGERVEITEKREDGWIWCVDGGGRGAWVPERYLKKEDHAGIALRRYTSKELTVSVGEVFAFIEEESGWTLCSRENGETGWIPSPKVRKVSSRL